MGGLLGVKLCGVKIIDVWGVGLVELLIIDLRVNGFGGFEEWLLRG